MSPVDATRALHAWALTLPMPTLDPRTLGARRVRGPVERLLSAALALRCHASGPLDTRTRADVGRAAATLREVLPAAAPRELVAPVLAWADDVTGGE